MTPAQRIERHNIRRWRHRFQEIGAPSWMAHEIVDDLFRHHADRDIPRAVEVLVEAAKVHGFRGIPVEEQP